MTASTWNGYTREQIVAALAALTPAERREYAALTDQERLTMIALHIEFPGARLVDDYDRPIR